MGCCELAVDGVPLTVVLVDNVNVEVPTVHEASLTDLRNAFWEARRTAALGARWAADDPGAPPDACRYCGRNRRLFAGSRLDGHAACVVGMDFKLRVGELLRSPLVSYKAVAAVIGVTPGVVRSWAFSVGIAGPISHRLRRVK